MMESNVWLILLLVFAGLILVTWLVVGNRKSRPGDVDETKEPELDEIETNTFGTDVPPHDHLNTMDASFGGQRPHDMMPGTDSAELHRQEEVERMEEERVRENSALVNEKDPDNLERDSSDAQFLKDAHDKESSGFDFIEDRDRDDYMAQPDFNDAEAGVADSPKPHNFDAVYDPEVNTDQADQQKIDDLDIREKDPVADRFDNSASQGQTITESKVYVTDEKEDPTIEQKDSQILPDDSNSLRTVNAETAPVGGFPGHQQDQDNLFEENARNTIAAEAEIQREGQAQMERSEDLDLSNNDSGIRTDFSEAANVEPAGGEQDSEVTLTTDAVDPADDLVSAQSEEGNLKDDNQAVTLTTDAVNPVDDLVATRVEVRDSQDENQEVILTHDSVSASEDLAQQDTSRKAVPAVSYEQLLNSPNGMKGQRVQISGGLASYFTEDLGVEGATALASLNVTGEDNTELIALKFVNPVSPKLATGDQIEVEGIMEGLKVNNQMVVPTMKVEKVNKK